MVVPVIVETDTAPVSAVSWPAIIAGGFVAAAFTLLLLALGAGLASASSRPGRPVTTSPPPGLRPSRHLRGGRRGHGVRAGGYITGRLRIRYYGRRSKSIS
jgi:hypothetical protein